LQKIKTNQSQIFSSMLHDAYNWHIKAKQSLKLDNIVNNNSTVRNTEIIILGSNHCVYDTWILSIYTWYND